MSADPCAICGQGAHRYGTTDPHHKFDAMGCVNMLLPALERQAELLRVNQDAHKRCDVLMAELGRKLAASEGEVERMTADYATTRKNRNLWMDCHAEQMVARHAAESSLATALRELGEMRGALERIAGGNHHIGHNNGWEGPQLRENLHLETCPACIAADALAAPTEGAGT